MAALEGGDERERVPAAAGERERARARRLDPVGRLREVDRVGQPREQLRDERTLVVALRFERGLEQLDRLAVHVPGVQVGAEATDRGAREGLREALALGD